MAVDHPKCDGFMKAKTRKRLAELQTALSLNLFSAAQERGQRRDLNATVEEMLAVLGKGYLGDESVV